MGVLAIVSAVATEPALNGWFDGRFRQLHDEVDLAIAIDTSEGLFAPVLRRVQEGMNLGQKLADLRAGVTDRTLPPEDFKGASITLSNYGMIGGLFAALVVTPPQLAIVGAGRIFEDILLVDGAPRARRCLPLSLTFDHRAVTGGEAARFVSALRAHLERATLDPEAES